MNININSNLRKLIIDGQFIRNLKISMTWQMKDLKLQLIKEKDINNK